MELKRLKSIAEFSLEEVKKIPVYKSEKYEIKALCFEVGQKIPSHSHANSDEIFQIVKGLAKITVGNDEYKVSHGGVVVGKNGISHSVENIGDKRLIVKSMFVPPLEAY